MKQWECVGYKAPLSIENAFFFFIRTNKGNRVYIPKESFTFKVVLLRDFIQNNNTGFPSPH